MTAYFDESDAELTRSIGIVDLHSDLPLALLKRRFERDDDSLRSFWLPRLRGAGCAWSSAPSTSTPSSCRSRRCAARCS